MMTTWKTEKRSDNRKRGREQERKRVEERRIERGGRVDGT